MKTKQRRHSILLAALTVIGAAAVHPISAAVLYWDPGKTGGVALGGSGNWNTNDTANTVWWSGTADAIWPNTTSSDAVFTGGGGTVTNSQGNATDNLRLRVRAMFITNHTGDYVFLDNGASSSRLVVLGNVTVASQSHDRTVTIALDQLGLANTSGGAVTDIRAFDVGTGDTVMIQVPRFSGGGYQATDHINATGAGGIKKLGAGTLILGGSTEARFSGGIQMSAGTLVADTAAALLTAVADNRLTFTGGTLDYRGITAIKNSVNFAGIVTLTSGGVSPMDYTFDGSANAGAAVLQLTNHSTLNIPAARKVTIAKSLNETASYSLTKTGSGALALSGEHYYTGGTIVSQGMLLVNNAAFSATGSGSVTVSNGAALGGSASLAGSVILAAGARLVMDLTVGDTNKLVIAGSLTLGSTNTVQLSLPAGTVPNGTYTLAEVSGTLSGSAANLAISAPLSRKTYTPVLDTSSTPQKLQIVVTGGAPASLVWQGDGVANVWNVATIPNWLNGVASDAFFNGDVVSFAAAGFHTPAVALASAVEPGSVSVNSDTDYTLGGSGRITGSGALTKAGAGTLTLATLNDYTGGTTINAGTLQLGNGITSGSIAGDVLNDAALVLDSPGDLTLVGVISGAGTLTKSNTNTVTLSGENTYSGGTVVNAGALSIGAGGTTGWVIGNITNQGSMLFNRSDDVSFDQVISGGGSVIQEGNGTLTLTAANTYTGLTWVRNGTAKLMLANLGGECVRGDILLDGSSGGTARQMRLGVPEQIADSAVVTMTSDGTAVRFYLQGHHETIAGLASSPSGNKDVRAVDSGDNLPATLTLKVPAGQSHVYAGGLNDALPGLNSALTIVKDGPGTQTFAGGGQNFSGGLAILDGTLVLGSVAANSIITNNASLIWNFEGFQFRTREIYGAGSILKTNTGALLLDAAVEAGSVTVAGGYLGGVGPITAPVTIGGAAALSPGPSGMVGTTTINGNLTLQGTTLVDINKDLLVETNDLVTGVQTLTYGGSLVVNNLGTTPLAVGDRFQLFSAASSAGNFTNITVTVPGSRVLTSFTPAAGTLLITAIVDPTPTNITYSLSGSTLELTWPASHLGWMAQSNALSVADANAWFDIPGSQSATNLSIPINPAMEKVFYRLQLPPLP